MCSVPADGWGFSAGGGSDTFPGGAGGLFFFWLSVAAGDSLGSSGEEHDAAQSQRDLVLNLLLSGTD